MACATITGGVATYELPFTQNEGRCLELVSALVTHKDGIAMADTTPSWFTSAAVGLNTALNTYVLTVTLTINATSAFEGDLDAVYTVRVEVQRCDCLGENEICTFSMLLKQPECGDPVLTETFLYALGVTTGTTRLWRLWLDSPDAANEFWRLCDTTNAGQANLTVDPTNDYVFTCDAADRIERSDLRGNSVTAVVTSASLIDNGVLAVDEARQKIYYALGSPAKSHPTIVSADLDGTGQADVFEWTGAANITHLRYDSGQDRIVFFGQSGGTQQVRYVPATGGTSTAIINDTGGSGGSTLHIDPTQGDEGHVFVRLNLAAETGDDYYEVNIATGAVVTSYTNMGGTSTYSAATIDQGTQRVYSVRETGGDAGRQVQRCAYGNGAIADYGPLFPETNIVAMRVVELFTTSAGYLDFYERQSAYVIDFNPQTTEEVFEDTGATDTAEVGDNVAAIREHGIWRQTLTQATAAARPLLIADSGVKVLEADGGDYLRLATTFKGTFLSTQNVAIYAVMKQDAATAQNPLMEFLATTASNRIALLTSWDDVLYFDYGDFSSGGRISAAQPGGWDDTWHVVEFHRNGTTDAQIVVDGTTVVNSSMSDLFSLSDGTFNLFRVDTGAALFDGRLARLIMYATVHDADQKSAVRAQLQSDYSALGV